MEIFKQCDGFLNSYEISNLGNLRRKLLGGGYKNVKGCILNRGLGYKYIQIQRDGIRYNFLFHHLVAKHFIGERPEGKVIDHIDRNSLNNNVENLRYCSQLENMRNSKIYKSHILTEGKERLKQLSRERDRRNGRVKDIRRKIGTGSICKRKNGKFRAVIVINKVRHQHQFDTKEECEKWLNSINPDKKN